MKGDQRANITLGYATHDCRKSYKSIALTISHAPKKKVLEISKIKVVKMNTSTILVLRA